MGHIFLIGYMGVGKSSIGSVLARKMKRPFIDLDERIERQAGIRIPEIFRSYGEDAFREWESETLTKLVEGPDAIIACGGGAPCFHGNLRAMKERGVLVHLQAEATTVLQRTRQDPRDRPKLEELTPEGVEAHMEERRPCYEEADIRLDTDELSPDALAERILKLHSR